MGSHGPRARSLLDWLFIGASAETCALAAGVALAPRPRAFAISALAMFGTAAANHTRASSQRCCASKFTHPFPCKTAGLEIFKDTIQICEYGVDLVTFIRRNQVHSCNILCQVAALHRDRVSRCVRLSNNHNHDRSVIALRAVVLVDVEAHNKPKRKSGVPTLACLGSTLHRNALALQILSSLETRCATTWAHVQVRSDGRGCRDALTFVRNGCSGWFQPKFAPVANAMHLVVLVRVTTSSMHVTVTTTIANVTATTSHEDRNAWHVAGFVVEDLRAVNLA